MLIIRLRLLHPPTVHPKITKIEPKVQPKTNPKKEKIIVVLLEVTRKYLIQF